jgi:hypothetical protein
MELAEMFLNIGLKMVNLLIYKMGLKLYCRQPHVNENDEIVTSVFDFN